VVPGVARGELLVDLDGRTVAVAVDGRRRGAKGADGSGHAPGEQPVTAPMPGRVVRVLVGPGDEVTARQGVVVVEAMKMENELRSPKAGRIKNVTVTPGMSVEAGRVLLVVE
jgi:biotin carboxyl carrier protein